MEQALSILRCNVVQREEVECGGANDSERPLNAALKLTITNIITMTQPDVQKVRSSITEPMTLPEA